MPNTGWWYAVGLLAAGVVLVALALLVDRVVQR